MKKILITLALVASFQFAFAQTGSKVIAQRREAASAAVASAQKAANDAKKAAKYATWLNLGKAYLQAQTAPADENWINFNKEQLALVMGGRLTPSSSETVTIGGQEYTKENYNGCDFYFAANGQLVMTVITEEVVPNALDKAFEAYKKAAELDVKGSKKDDIVAAFTKIAQYYVDEAYNAYQLGDFVKASGIFEKSGIVSETAPLSKGDFSQYYNAGYTAYMAGNLERAKKLLDLCLEKGYEHEDGAVYTYLAKIADQSGDK